MTNYLKFGIRYNRGHALTGCTRDAVESQRVARRIAFICGLGPAPAHLRRSGSRKKLSRVRLDNASRLAICARRTVLSSESNINYSVMNSCAIISI